MQVAEVALPFFGPGVSCFHIFSFFPVLVFGTESAFPRFTLLDPLLSFR